LSAIRVLEPLNCRKCKLELKPCRKCRLGSGTESQTISNSLHTRPALPCSNAIMHYAQPMITTRAGHSRFTWAF